jgi:hypothetical protein
MVQRWAESGMPEFFSPYGYEIRLSSTAPRPAVAHSATCAAGAELPVESGRVLNPMIHLRPIQRPRML